MVGFGSLDDASRPCHLPVPEIAGTSTVPGVPGPPEPAVSKNSSLKVKGCPLTTDAMLDSMSAPSRLRCPIQTDPSVA